MMVAVIAESLRPKQRLRWKGQQQLVSRRCQRTSGDVPTAYFTPGYTVLQRSDLEN